jgi:hypothetical protein
MVDLQVVLPSAPTSLAKIMVIGPRHDAAVTHVGDSPEVGQREHMVRQGFQSGKELLVALKAFFRLDTIGALTAVNVNEANLSRAIYVSPEVTTEDGEAFAREMCRALGHRGSYCMKGYATEIVDFSRDLLLFKDLSNVGKDGWVHLSESSHVFGVQMNARVWLLDKCGGSQVQFDTWAKRSRRYRRSSYSRCEMASAQALFYRGTGSGLLGPPCAQSINRSQLLASST